MTQNYRDPVSFLNESVTKRGKSGPDGVYLHNVTVVAESESDYGYKTFYGNPVTPTSAPVGMDEGDWSSLLIKLRSDSRSLSQQVSVYDNSVWQFLPEGGTLSMNVFFPVVNISTFPHRVKQAQETLLCLADFASKVPGNIRFSIGIVTKSWRDMAEQGEVEEMDLSY